MRDLTVGRLRAGLLVLALCSVTCTDGAAPTTSTEATTTTTRPAPTTTTTTTTTTTIPVPDLHGGTITVGLVEEPSTLNPLLAAGDTTVELLAEAWTTGVYDVSGESGELVPDVVVALPSVDNGGLVLNPDGTMTVSYEIRPEARWADGVPISGRDFQLTLETILDPALSIPRDVYRDILSSTAGEKTFSYTMAFPTMAFERLFPVVVPQHAVAGSDFALDWNDRAWISAGPFELESWAPGEAIVFRRNDAYWKVDDASGANLPYLDGVDFRVIEDPADQVAAFARGELDVLELSTTNAGEEELTGLEALGARVATDPGPVWVHMNFQFGPGRLDRNPDSLNEYLSFRRAVMHAIDRQRIVDVLYGGRVAPLDSYVSVYDEALSGDAWARYDHDPEAAGSLLAEALEARSSVDEDAPAEATVFFTTNAGNVERATVTELIAEMLAEIGVTLNVSFEDPLVFFGETVSAGRWDTALWAWQARPGIHGLVTFHDVLDPGDSASLTNFYRWGTPDSVIQDEWSFRYGLLVAAMEETVARADLAELVQEAERIAADQALFLPLYAEPRSVAYWPDELHGLVTGGLGPFTGGIERWRTRDVAE